MRRFYFKQLAHTVLFFLFMAFAFACSTSKNMSSTKNTSSKEIDKPDINIAESNNIQKRALRIRAKVLTEAVEKGKVKEYEIEVTEIVQYGANFSSVEPGLGEKVILSVPKDIIYENGSTILIDVITPLTRDEERLTVRKAIN